MLYDLVGVVVHHGGALSSGHYTAYVRVGPAGPSARWFHVDDARATHVTAEAVEASEAYLLFYERRQNADHASRRRRVLDQIKQHAEVRKPGRPEEMLLTISGWPA